MVLSSNYLLKLFSLCTIWMPKLRNFDKFESDTNLPGQSSEGLALTAYVTLALLEAESDSDIKTDSRFATGKNLALDFLTRNLEGLTDPYAVSIITFVLTKADHYSKQGAFNILEG